MLSENPIPARNLLHACNCDALGVSDTVHACQVGSDFAPDSVSGMIVSNKHHAIVVISERAMVKWSSGVSVVNLGGRSVHLCGYMFNDCGLLKCARH